jgi:hypothetical protein
VVKRWSGTVGFGGDVGFGDGTTGIRCGVSKEVEYGRKLPTAGVATRGGLPAGRRRVGHGGPYR